MSCITLNPEEAIKKRFPNSEFNFDKATCRKAIDFLLDAKYREYSGCFGGFFTKYSAVKNYISYYFHEEYNECLKDYGIDVFVQAKTEKQTDNMDKEDWYFVLNDNIEKDIKLISNLYVNEITVPRIEISNELFDFKIKLHLISPGSLARKCLIDFDYFPTQIYYIHISDEVYIPLDFFNINSKELIAILPNSGMTDHENENRILRIKKMIFKGFHFNRDVLRLIFK